jgi:hypothetical protein
MITSLAEGRRLAQLPGRDEQIRLHERIDRRLRPGDEHAARLPAYRDL